jgi:RNA polymerase sigma-70 factor (ECF subfamily)
MPLLEGAPDIYGPILERVRAGDSAAIEDLLEKAVGIARRYSDAICGRAPDREDALQEALLRTFKHAARIREPRAFRSWLYRTVKNACLVGRRKKGFEAPALPVDAIDSHADDSPGVQAMLEQADDRDRLRTALSSLSATYREVVFLRDLEGLSTREVAEVLETSEANVKVRLHRPHPQLRRRLNDR